MSSVVLVRAAVLSALLLAACNDTTGPNTPLVAPEDIEAAATSAVSARVVFMPVEGADSYRIERAIGEGPFAQVATTSNFYYDDIGLQPATVYRYRVTAMRGSQVGPPTVFVETQTLAAGSRQAVLIGPIAANRTLFADSQYVLRRVAKVMSGATLTIQPGTLILGDINSPPSLLLVGRGARIMAVGTAANPIVFTSSRPFGERLPGDWGGIAIVGNATTNLSQPADVEAPPPYTERFTGGTNDDDNSGTLRYVRIEFAGRASVAGHVQNALTMLAVGRATTIEYVQVIAALNDSFKWFGGTVDGRYLVSYEVGDDHFDASMGYRGRNQFLVGLRSRRIDPSPAPGQNPANALAFELDGCEPDFPACAPARRPATVPVFANFSIVDTRPNFSEGWSGGAQFRDETGGFLVNGTIVNVRAFAVSVLDDGSNGMRQRDSLVLSNLLLANPENFGPGHASRSNWAGRNLEESSLTFSQLFTSVPASLNPAGDPRIDWTPASGSPLASGGLTTFSGTLADRAGTFIVPTSYRGAAAPGGSAWWDAWTVYYVR